MNFPLSTFHFPLSRHSRRAGFTLIEILVATTILLVIVILASLVFQQTTGAYQTGERKVNAQVALRNIVGAVTRDLALAVDARDYGDIIDDTYFPDTTGNRISFVALTGTPGIDVDGKKDEKSSTARLIEYSGGERKETTLTCRGRGSDGSLIWEKGAATAPVQLFDEESYEGADDFEVKYTCVWPENDPDAELPERVYIRVELTGNGQAATVGAGSGGRRGWGSPDEIWVGAKPD